MRVSVCSNDPDQTARLAEKTGAYLGPGDCLLLAGPVGAGKTHFARHLIQSLLRAPEDVPSPTFTLVQAYETSVGELWHADLYRLSALEEIEELGLVDAFDQAICLIEWPELLGSVKPATALEILFEPVPDAPNARRITLQSAARRWMKYLSEFADDI